MERIVHETIHRMHAHSLLLKQQLDQEA